MTRSDQEAIGDLGVIKAAEFFVRDKHIFREQAKSDHGIDAYVEFRDDNAVVTGRLIALQIKAGTRVVREQADGSWALYASEEKLNYWLNFALPVFVVFWHAPTEVLYAKEVQESALVPTRAGNYKIIFDADDRLTGDLLKVMVRRADGTEADHRFSLLRIGMSMREGMREEQAMLAGVQHWHADGHADFCQVVLHRDELSADSEVARWNLRLSADRIPEFLRDVFPWADVQIDEDTYRSEGVDDWSQEIADRDLSPADFPFDEWWKLQPRDRPYAQDDEVSNWMYRLMVNDLGRAWTTIDRYAARGITHSGPRT